MSPVVSFIWFGFIHPRFENRKVSVPDDLFQNFEPTIVFGCIVWEVPSTLERVVVLLSRGHVQTNLETSRTRDGVNNVVKYVDISAPTDVMVLISDGSVIQQDIWLRTMCTY